MNSPEDVIWRGAQEGEVTGELPDLDVDEGQRVQLQVLEKWISAGEALAGYKIGLTSGAARNAFGPGIRPFGYILKSRVLYSGDSLDYAARKITGIENELVFRISKDINVAAMTVDEASRIVDSVAPGFEINQGRLKTANSNGARVADNLSQWGIVVGEFRPTDQHYEQLVVKLSKDGELTQETAAADHIDDHFASIAALVARLHRFGRGLRAGELIITGSFTRQPLTGPGSWCGDFGEIGQVMLEVQ